MESMLNNSSNLRKAAVLIRGLDGETAAKLLAQLSAQEADAIRKAVCELGAVKEDEQAHVVEELRRGRTIAAQRTENGVELNLSSYDIPGLDGATLAVPVAIKRFEFLENAPVETIAGFLAREQAQTTAVVLSYLDPSRAAAVLGALPAKRQAETLERLSCLGESDPESISVVERELAVWAARQPTARRNIAIRNSAVESILLAADESTRGTLLANLRVHNDRLAAQLSPTRAPSADKPSAAKPPLPPPAIPRQNRSTAVAVAKAANVAFKFEDLIHLSDSALANLLRAVNPQLLVLALVGSSEKLVDRIARFLPQQQAKVFRGQLRKLGPTRLSDVESAQHAVAEAATRSLASHQSHRAVVA